MVPSFQGIFFLSGHLAENLYPVKKTLSTFSALRCILMYHISRFAEEINMGSVQKSMRIPEKMIDEIQAFV